MTNKTFFTRLTIGIALFFGIVFGAQAINISVPSSPGAGYWLTSTTTGAYISTTTSPIMVGYVNATSTTASTFPYASTTALTVSGNSYLGTVSSGIWNGTAVGVAYGGTGLASWTSGDVLYAGGATTLAGTSTAN